MKKAMMLILTAGFGIGLALGNVPSIFAQDEFTLEEITVTAQKREENQQNVPIAMDVVSGDEIKELGQNDISEILSNISSLIVSKASDGFRVSLRSISVDQDEEYGLSTNNPTVSINTDGVFSNRLSSGQGLYDLERVEVLYGPQSTMYAATSPGGVVNIVTAAPKTDIYEASGTLEYGNYNLLHTEGMVNVPLSDRAALRAAFSTSAHDGYLSNGSDDENSASARIRALLKPNDRLSFTLTAEYEKSTGQGFSGVEIFETPDDTSNPWTAATEETGPGKSNSASKLYGNIEWDLGFGSLTIVPAYTTKSYSTSSTETTFTGDTVTYVVKDDGRDKGVELRMTSSEDFPFKWIFGANWYKSVHISDRTGDDDSYRIHDSTFIVKALYGNVTYPVTEQFRATGGLRYSWDQNKDSMTRSPDVIFGETEPVVDAKLRENVAPDYKLGIEYDVAENSMLYADWSTSFRTQFGNDPLGRDYPPEELVAYTLGSKNRFFGNKVQVNVSGYFYQYTNYATAGGIMSLNQKDLNGDGDYDDLDQWDPDTQAYRDESVRDMDFNARALGDADVYGVDLQTSTLLTEKDKLDFSVSYLKTEFTKLFMDYWESTNRLGIPDQDYAGKGMTFNPAWTVNAVYSHNFNLMNGGILTGRFDVKYQSEYDLTYNELELSFDSDWNPVIESVAGRTQEAYHLSNFSAIYAHPDGKWTLTGYVKNIENYAVKLLLAGNSLQIGAPRTYGAVLTVNY